MDIYKQVLFLKFKLLTNDNFCYSQNRRGRMYDAQQ